MVVAEYEDELVVDSDDKKRIEKAEKAAKRRLAAKHKKACHLKTHKMAKREGQAFQPPRRT